ncbi:nitronate monooxygenase [Sphaerisporangium sp. NBC_01403]|uniref:nitronate monooxygenase n=1 Tax=Sphaerisporangium sp. NBC_01403 TaxID=2903599 RepID=UPI00324F0058
MEFPVLRHPIVQAPMAGGPSTPELAAAVSAAGGLGFVAAGYDSAETLRAGIRAVRARTDAPFGVNIFVPSAEKADQAAVDAYAARLRGEAERYGVPLGVPVDDDGEWRHRLAVVAEERVPVVSFTFGLPSREVIEEARRAGAYVIVTVTTPDEAVAAHEAGADALVAQGIEAGGHRGGFTDDAGDFGLLVVLRLALRLTPLPVVAAGGITDGAGVAAVLAAGAVAAQLGTAFLLAPEAGTSVAHREALRSYDRTAVTRAFTGRRARGLVNRFLEEHTGEAPSAYPQVHHLTAPLRAAARKAGDAGAINLWAGQGFRLAEEVPAGELVRRLGAEAEEALTRAAHRLGHLGR